MRIRYGRAKPHRSVAGYVYTNAILSHQLVSPVYVDTIPSTLSMFHGIQ
jgi:hypothetical protein